MEKWCGNLKYFGLNIAVNDLFLVSSLGIGPRFIP